MKPCSMIDESYWRRHALYKRLQKKGSRKVLDRSWREYRKFRSNCSPTHTVLSRAFISQALPFSCITLKSWKWPGDKATVHLTVTELETKDRISCVEAKWKVYLYVTTGCILLSCFAPYVDSLNLVTFSKPGSIKVWEYSHNCYTFTCVTINWFSVHVQFLYYYDLLHIECRDFSVASVDIHVYVVLIKVLFLDNFSW